MIEKDTIVIPQHASIMLRLKFVNFLVTKVAKIIICGSQTKINFKQREISERKTLKKDSIMNLKYAMFILGSDSFINSRISFKNSRILVLKIKSNNNSLKPNFLKN